MLFYCLSIYLLQVSLLGITAPARKRSKSTFQTKINTFKQIPTKIEIYTTHLIYKQTIETRIRSDIRSCGTTFDTFIDEEPSTFNKHNQTKQNKQNE